MIDVATPDPLHDAVRAYRLAAQRIRSGDHSAARDVVEAGRRIREDLAAPELHRLLARAASRLRPDQNLEAAIAAAYSLTEARRRSAARLQHEAAVRAGIRAGMGVASTDPRNFVAPTW